MSHGRLCHRRLQLNIQPLRTVQSILKRDDRRRRRLPLRLSELKGRSGSLRESRKQGAECHCESQTKFHSKRPPESEISKLDKSCISNPKFRNPKLDSAVVQFRNLHSQRHFPTTMTLNESGTFPRPRPPPGGGGLGVATGR